MKLKREFIATALVAACLASAPLADAETVSQKQASKIAETFFNAANGIYMPPSKLEWNGRQLTTDRLFSPFYIYNHPKGGFVIISADTKAFPIIGYSKTGRFDRAKMTDEEKDLLTQYAHEIELIRYDSRQPVRAMDGWRNLPLYINRILHNPYDTPEYESLTDERREVIEAIDRRNSSVMLPSAVEFVLYHPENYRGYTLDDASAAEADEEIPFSFYENFLAEIAAEEETRAAALDELIAPTVPVVERLGGAHFAIRFPAPVKMSVLYSLQGRRLSEKYYSHSENVNIDLSAQPAGFYVLMVLGEDGKIYAFKLYR